MSGMKRREFLKAALASVIPGVPEMPAYPPPGPQPFPGVGPFDPRQPGKPWLDPRQQFQKKVYKNPSPASPIHLSGSVLLRSGASGTVPTAALKNPMGQDMEILEIKWEVSSVLQGGSGNQNTILGGSIWCDLVMGGVKLTNGAIPIWNFGRAENLDGEENAGVVANGTDYTYGSYSWKLPRPLFVPAGAVVLPNFSHLGFIPDPINVRIGYSARTVFTKPKRLYIPWVAKYATKAFNPISAADTDQSSELDLVNPFLEKVYLQRFVGRTQRVRQSEAAGEDAPQSFGSQFLLLRMKDSYGRPLIRTYTPFRSVFAAPTRSWEMDNGAWLDPESFYTVTIRKDVTSLDAGTDTGAVGQAFVSLVGWREVDA